VRMLAESPQKSDIVIKLDHQHQFFSAVLKD